MRAGKSGHGWKGCPGDAVTLATKGASLTFSPQGSPYACTGPKQQDSASGLPTLPSPHAPGVTSCTRSHSSDSASWGNPVSGSHAQQLPAAFSPAAQTHLSGALGALGGQQCLPTLSTPRNSLVSQGPCRSLPWAHARRGEWPLMLPRLADL